MNLLSSSSLKICDPTCTYQATPWTSRGSPEFHFWMFTFEELRAILCITWTFSVCMIYLWWLTDPSPWAVFFVQLFQPNSLLLEGWQASFRWSKNRFGFGFLEWNHFDKDDFPPLYTVSLILSTLCCILLDHLIHNTLVYPWKDHAHIKETVQYF